MDPRYLCSSSPTNDSCGPGFEHWVMKHAKGLKSTDFFSMFLLWKCSKKWIQNRNKFSDSHQGDLQTWLVYCHTSVIFCLVGWGVSNYLYHFPEKMVPSWHGALLCLMLVIFIKVRFGCLYSLVHCYITQCLVDLKKFIAAGGIFVRCIMLASL